MAITIKTDEEIRIMRESGKILAKTLEETCKFACEGKSTWDLDQFAERMIRQSGALPSFKGYHGFPGTLCTCLNEVIVHGIPRRDKILKNGDLLTIDCGVLHKGFHTDAARTIVIGESNNEKNKLLETAERTLQAVTDFLKPGIALNEIGKLIEKMVTQKGYHIIHDLTGHGVGRKLHEDPIVLNYWENRPGPILKPGMTLAIEPIFSVGTSKMRTLSDDWTIITQDGSLAIQIENTFLLTQDGNEVLTQN